MYVCACVPTYHHQGKKMCSCNSIRKNMLVILRFLMILLLNSNTQTINHCCDIPWPSLTNLSTFNMEASLKALNVRGHFDFHETEQAAGDFGNRYHSLPMAILYPKAVSDISTTVKHVFDLGSASEVTVAARGNGHSLNGQALAPHGIVISMESLREPKMHVHTGKQPYVDVSGGALWIDILHETLKYGFTPRSWTDYLHLTVGGTLSNAGISGQAFRHGPQINNVYQLEVVTGRGDVVTCSDKQEADLFYAVLGGLGQFGIITRARIALEPAPKMVKWIRVLYSDFPSFTKDQEHLISLENSFDYVEGFVIINRTGLVPSWKSSFNPKYPLQASLFTSEGRTLYCLEIAKYISQHDKDTESVDQKIDNILSQLDYIPHTLFLSEVSYEGFLDRVHTSEIKLRKKGLWDVPHPWLNLLVPWSSIHEFAEEVFGNIIVDNSNSPILIYPVNQSRWNDNTSMITPEEDVFYPVAFLSSAVPSSTGANGLEHILTQNKRILEFCERAGLGVKQYLPHYSNQEQWKVHFGIKWELFVQRKLSYDPLAILAPGQRIFKKATTIS